MQVVLCLWQDMLWDVVKMLLSEAVLATQACTYIYNVKVVKWTTTTNTNICKMEGDL